MTTTTTVTIISFGYLLLVTSPVEVLTFTSASIGQPQTKPTTVKIFRRKRILSSEPDRRRRWQHDSYARLETTSMINTDGDDDIRSTQVVAFSSLSPTTTTTATPLEVALDPFRSEDHDKSRTVDEGSTIQLQPKKEQPKSKINRDDDVYREINEILPRYVQYFLREIGFIRWVLNCSILLGLPSLIEQHPSVLKDAVQLWFGWSWPRRAKNSSTVVSNGGTRILPQRRSIKYGQNSRQVIEFWGVSCFTVEDDNDENSTTPRRDETIVFVHGGAWGTGFPAMYMLVALPFLREGYNVAVVGYRTYPDANALQQADDVADAIHTLQQDQETRQNEMTRTRQQPETGLTEDSAKNSQSKQRHRYTLIGHSSGSHICSLAIVRGKMSSIADSSTCTIDRFVSLAGVFDVREHYKFEKLRGLARISPMAAACSGSDYQIAESPTSEASTRKNGKTKNSIFARWRNNSPIHLIEHLTDIVTKADDSCIYLDGVNQLPPSGVALPSNIMLVHGVDDTTCPYWYSQNFAEVLVEYQKKIEKTKTKPTTYLSAVMADDDDRDDEEGRDGEDQNASRVDLNILESSGHAELLLELIFGGTVQDLVLGWLDRLGNAKS